MTGIGLLYFDVDFGGTNLQLEEKTIGCPTAKFCVPKVGFFKKLQTKQI
jgi:hypothetical protein